MSTTMAPAAATDAELGVELGAGVEITPLPRILMWLGIGLVALPLGGQVLVSGATDIARVLGISEAVIGLTLVAVGTSLPELATSVIAALRGRADLALGNVIGSTLLAWCWDDIAAPLATHWQKVNLLNAFGPFGGLLATYLLLLIALLLVIAWERHFFRRQSAAVRTVKESA